MVYENDAGKGPYLEVIVLVLSLIALLAAPPVPRIAIYVGPQTRDGFVEVDKGIRDSIKDLKAELLETKLVRIVESEKAATMSLYVLGRGIGPPSGGGSAINIPIGATSMSFMIAAKARHVDTVLRFGDYERAFVGDDHGTEVWRECAEAIAKDVAIWLSANRERIAEMAPTK